MKTLQTAIDEFRSDYKTSITQIQEDILSIRDTVITNLINENKKLRKRVLELEDRIDDAQDDIADLEVHSHQLEQYTRRNNLEISGIPKDVKD